MSKPKMFTVPKGSILEKDVIDLINAVSNLRLQNTERLIAFDKKEFKKYQAFCKKREKELKNKPTL